MRSRFPLRLGTSTSHRPAAANERALAEESDCSKQNAISSPSEEGTAVVFVVYEEGAKAGLSEVTLRPSEFEFRSVGSSR